MNSIIIHIGHPAHLHLFRYPIQEWRNKGIDVRLALRDKDITVELAQKLGLTGKTISKAGKGLFSGLVEIFRQDFDLLKLVRNHPGVLIGSSIAIAHVGRLQRLPSLICNEDDLDVLRMIGLLSFPFCTAIACPTVVRMGPYESKILRYPSYHELYYLHPNRFKPNPQVINDMGLDSAEPYAIIRLSALSAHHDKGISGVKIELLRRIINLLDGKIRLFISSECALADEFEPYRYLIAPEKIHDALMFADFFIGDSQTMTAEAAVLGTPSFRLNSFVGRISYLEELERYGLAFGFKPGQENDLIKHLDWCISLKDRGMLFDARRKRMLQEKIDPLKYFVKVVEMFLEGVPLEDVKRESRFCFSPIQN